MVVCGLIGHMFIGVQWADVSNMKMMSKNISSPLSLAYPNFFVGSLAGANTAVFPRTSVLRGLIKKNRIFDISIRDK